MSTRLWDEMEDDQAATLIPVETTASVAISGAVEAEMTMVGSGTTTLMGSSTLSGATATVLPF